MFSFLCLDLERNLSLRTTREELIRRGVLKDVDDTPPPPAQPQLGKSLFPGSLGSFFGLFETPEYGVVKRYAQGILAGRILCEDQCDVW